MSLRIASLLLVPCLFGCSREETPGASALTHPAPSAFRASAALEPLTIGERCTDCHPQHVASYRETGMARAVGPLDAEELASLGPARDAAGWTYRFEQDGRSARIVETWKDGARGVTGEILFAIGAGLMDRSYAAAVGDLMWFAPLEVVGAGEARETAMAPGHTIKPGLRFGVPIAEECLACHTDKLPPRAYPLNLRPDPSTWAPSGISCAACHADAEAHAEWRERELSGAERQGTDPILAARSASLGAPGADSSTRSTSWVESLSLCARCHLQGDASFLLEPRARGVLPPGGDMLERRAVFVPASPTDEVGFVSHVERLVLAPCFVRSIELGREPPTCVTCHDPHRSSFDPSERPRVRAGCLSCHTGGEMHCALAEEQRKGSDCVQCHMRTSGVFDVAHVEIHDHFIRKRPTAPSAPGPMRLKESTDGKLSVFAWPGKPAPVYADDQGLWMMAMMAYGRPDLALSHAEREPGPTSRALASYHHLRGSLLEMSARLEDARAAYERALALDPGALDPGAPDPGAAESAVNLGLLLGKVGKPREGLERLDALVAAHPKAASALRNRAVLRFQLGDSEGFAADLQRAFEVSPNAAVAGALADHNRKMGRAREAERWARIARENDPSSAARH